jgi:hypothetical protein
VLPVKVKVRVEGKRRVMLMDNFVARKVQELREFGYPSLTEQEVREEVENILAGKELTVIGQFIKPDLILYE